MSERPTRDDYRLAAQLCRRYAYKCARYARLSRGKGNIERADFWENAELDAMRAARRFTVTYPVELKQDATA